MPLFTIPKWDLDKPLAGHNMREKFFMQNGHPQARCAHFELDFLQCADGLGRKRANELCKQEWEDFIECGSSNKATARRTAIREHRDKLVKEGKWPPK